MVYTDEGSENEDDGDKVDSEDDDDLNPYTTGVPYMRHPEK